MIVYWGKKPGLVINIHVYSPYSVTKTGCILNNITLTSWIQSIEKKHFPKTCIYIHMYKGFLFLQHITLVKFLWSKKLLKSLTEGLGSSIAARIYQSFLLFKVLHTLICLNARDLWWKHKKTRGPWTTSLTWETSSNQWIHLSKAMITCIYIIKLAQ